MIRNLIEPSCASHPPGALRLAAAFGLVFILAGCYLDGEPPIPGQERQAVVALQRAAGVEFEWGSDAAYCLYDSKAPRCRDGHVTWLRLSGGRLESLPGEISQLGDLRYLDLSSNPLGELPAEIGQLKQLAWLKLNHTHLASLPAEIGQLEQLAYLELNDNRLSELEGEIGQLERLERLDLSANELVELPEEIGQLGALGRLNLAGNRLAALPQGIERLDALESLDLSDNRFTELPQALARLPRLRHLDVSGNPLSGPLPALIAGMPLEYFGFDETALCVPEDAAIQAWMANSGRPGSKQIACGMAKADRAAILALSRLAGEGSGWPGDVAAGKQPCGWPGVECWWNGHVRSLELTGAGLETLPEEIGQLSQLAWLYLGGNRLTRLPPEIGQLGQLQALDLSDNQLEELPQEIGQLNNLQALHLGGNRLARMPETIGQLSNLRELALHDNRLTQLPEQIGELASLRSLTLDGNPLSGPLPGFLMATPLGMLNIQETGLCTPRDEAMQAWLAEMPGFSGGPECR
ncbi:MAG: leucine-rich repeat protein [Anaerolineales bacterium]|nr:leucine-rich repeat protein [Anaerolineales bacterium]